MKAPRNDRPAGCPSGVFLRSGMLTLQTRGWMVGGRCWFQLVAHGFLLACVSSFAQGNQNQKLDSQYQSAVAEYDAGHFADAGAQLEKLLPYAPKSFEIHEMLGLVYASQSQDSKAIEHLKVAVQLKPDSGAARTNLAASLVHAGKPELALEQFQKALQLEPQDYDANHNLGEFYIQLGRIADARPLLEQAQRINPSSYDNSYDLAQADFLIGRNAEARLLAQSLIQQKNTGELHNLLGQIEEKDGKFVEAVNEFQTAVHMDPSEDNLFDWGSELLLHRTYDPAIEVFQQGTQRFPASPRLQTGLGMALDLRGRYDDAVKALLAAADLDPTDARCYLFLSKAYGSSPNQAEDVIRRFRRYAELQPNNALAQYYYAMSLWKGKLLEDTDVNFQTVESLLKKSVTLDDKLAEAHVQLGNLYADRHAYDKSMPEYVRALELNPNLPDAHYRLGQDYVHTGQKEQAQTEFAVYQKLRAQHLADEDKERAEVQQFVYSAKTAPSDAADKP
jgi:tetratricopeptide (TPR) repeat protein